MNSWLFVTLTYPAVWPSDPAVWKRHLDLFWQRYRRRYPEAAAIWKLEPQRRGAPHYHLMVVHQDPVVDLKQERADVAFAWFNVVGSNDPKHLVAGVGVDRVAGERQATSYVAKYLGKAADFIEPDTGEARPVGRYWGVLGRQFLPVDRVECNLTLDEYYRLRRLARRVWKHAGNHGGYSPQGFAVYMGWQGWERLVRWVCGSSQIDRWGCGVDDTEGG